MFRSTSIKAIDAIVTDAPIAARRTNDMTFRIEPQHDLSSDEVEAIEDRLYDHNSHATGHHDGQGLGFVLRDNAGQMIGVAAGDASTRRLMSATGQSLPKWLVPAESAFSPIAA